MWERVPLKIFVLALVGLCVLVTAGGAAETAELKVRFEYDSVAPDQEKIVPNQDAAFCGKHDLRKENLVVDPETKGIKNVVLYVYTGRGGTKLPKMPSVNATHRLDNKDCRFEPHILITQVGDTLEIGNPDPVAHNANLNFFNNTSQNLTIPPKQSVTVELEKDEPAPIPVECNIHPWMKGYVVVLEHPYAGVSEADGTLVIKGLPAGEDLTFRVYHEALKIKEVEEMETGKTKKFKRARIELELEPGMNDLGTWVVPAA